MSPGLPGWVRGQQGWGYGEDWALCGGQEAPGSRCEGAGENGQGHDFHSEGGPMRSEGAGWGDAPWGTGGARSRGGESSWELGSGALRGTAGGEGELAPRGGCSPRCLAPPPLPSFRVPGHAESPGPVHLHCRPAAAALRCLLHQRA